MADFIWYNPATGVPIISIAGYGITLNTAAFEMLNHAQWVRLGFDPVSGLLAIKPASKSDPQGVALGKLQRGVTRIHRKDFIRLLQNYRPDLNFDRTVRYLARWDAKQGMMLIDLSRPLERGEGAQRNLKKEGQ